MHVGIIPFIPSLIYKSKWYKLVMAGKLSRYAVFA